MPRIYDYGTFSSAKNQSLGGNYNFGMKMDYVDIDIHNRPDEYDDINEASAFIEYSVSLGIRKNGISDINFGINSVELEFKTEDYPNPPKEFDIDLIPGKTIDIGQVQADVEDYKIPTYPSGLVINMNKSTDPKKFDVTVKFGTSKYS